MPVADQRILDTNIVSYLMRGHTIANHYIKHLQGKLLALAFITVGELYYGAEKAGWGDKKRLQLETVLKRFVIIPYDHRTARHYRIIVADRERLGRPITGADAWIAACALRYNAPLVTHNVRDFLDIAGLEIISEPGP